MALNAVIPNNRMPIVDERTGLVSREWYLYLAALGGFDASSITALSVSQLTASAITSIAITSSSLVVSTLSAQSVTILAVRVSNISATFVTSTFIFTSSVTAGRIVVSGVSANFITVNSVTANHIICNIAETDSILGGLCGMNTVSAISIGSLAYAVGVNVGIDKTVTSGVSVLTFQKGLLISVS